MMGKQEVAVNILTHVLRFDFFLLLLFLFLFFCQFNLDKKVYIKSELEKKIVGQKRHENKKTDDPNKQKSQLE